MMMIIVVMVVVAISLGAMANSKYTLLRGTLLGCSLVIKSKIIDNLYSIL